MHDFFYFYICFASSYQLPSGRKYYGIKREIQKKEHPKLKWETHFFLPQLWEEVMIWRHKSGSILLWKNCRLILQLCYHLKHQWHVANPVGDYPFYIWNMFENENSSILIACLLFKYNVVIIPLNPLLLTQKDKFFFIAIKGLCILVGTAFSLKDFISV